MPVLPQPLVTGILQRLGVSPVHSPDLATLQQIYKAWCLRVPFENTRKMIALVSEQKQELPGLDAVDFFQNWLAHGTGGTCWPMANAFCELLQASGYEAVRIAGHMRDMPVLNHGSVKVKIDGKDYLAEASLLFSDLFPLDREVIIKEDAVNPVELEREGNDHLAWFCPPPMNEFFYCRLKAAPVDLQMFEQRYEASREMSLFNERIYAKKNYPGKIVVIWGNNLFLKSAAGMEHRQLNRVELCEALHKEIGISEPLLEMWADSGGLEASFVVPNMNRPPAFERQPPSRR